MLELTMFNVKQCLRNNMTSNFVENNISVAVKLLGG